MGFISSQNFMNLRTFSINLRYFYFWIHAMGNQQSSSPSTKPNNRSKQWKITFPDYVKEAEHTIKLQELLFELKAESLSTASSTIYSNY